MADLILTAAERLGRRWLEWAQYLKWAPMLIAAEEYWAGNLSIKEPNHVD